MTLDMPGMSWIELIWPMIGAASLTLAAVHLVIWVKDKGESANLMFALTAVSVAIIAILELRMMQARTPEEYGYLLRWAHVPIAAMIVGMVAFVRLHLHAGSMALAVSTCLTRAACLLPNFLSGANVEFTEVTTLQGLTVWGSGPIAVPLQVIHNPWVWLAHLNVILLLLFLASAVLQVWRRGPSPERRSAALICGSMVFFTFFAKVWPMVVVNGQVEGPVIISPAYLCVLLVMGYQLGGDMLRASQLAGSLLAAEANLHDTQRKMDQAVDAAGLGLWNLDIPADRYWLSNIAMRMLELAPEQGEGIERIKQNVHPEDRRLVDASLREIANGNGKFRCEFRVVLADETRRWVSMRGQVESGGQRAPLRVNGVLADISERKYAEQRFELVIERAPMAMLMVDPEGMITVANEQSQTLFGFSNAELTGMSVDRLVPGRFPGDEKVGRWKFMVPPHTIGVSRELFGVRKDGREVPIDIALNPIPMERGLYMLVSLIDLSERNRLEQESALQRDELAHLSRVALLTELSGSLTHELNQPLTAILSNAQAAIRFLDHVPPNLDEVRDGLANIVESDKRAGEVIRRLRTLLRKERTDHELLDVNEVVRDVLRIIRNDLLNRQVEVVLDLADNLTAVLGDKVQLQQVLLNLIMNASDAMKDPGHNREILLRTSPTPDGGVAVSVVDAGIGIPGGDIEYMFLPFMTTKPEGLGLGLAICKTIINGHAGSLWAANNDGPGATVGFRLPANTAQAVHGAPPA